LEDITKIFLGLRDEMTMNKKIEVMRFPFTEITRGKNDSKVG